MGLRATSIALGALVSLAPASAAAFPALTDELPCDPSAEPCVLCHLNRDAGSGCATPPCLDAFGEAWVGRSWHEVAALDSDGDGFTDGDELGDPTGSFVPGAPVDCTCASDPGEASSTPTFDRDGDGTECSVDCDDDDPSVTACPCAVAADCDDSDPCTIDLCVGSACAHDRRSDCGDGATTPGGTASCGCRADGGDRSPAFGALALLLLGSARRQRA